MAMPTSPTYPVFKHDHTPTNTCTSSAQSSPESTDDEVTIPNLSGAMPTQPKRKDTRVRDRPGYHTKLKQQKRSVECKAAGVPYTKHIKLARATSQIVEQIRKAARPDEREENKEDMKVVLKQTMGLPADIEDMTPAQKKEWHKSQQASNCHFRQQQSKFTTIEGGCR